MTTNHIMLDLETLATCSNAAVTSIGAIAFNPITGEINENTFHFNVLPKSSQEAGLVIDGGTVSWWLTQSKEAQDSMTRGQIPLKAALTAFSRWLGDVCGSVGPQVWGNGSTFDNVILGNAYTAVGLPRPWSYRADNCYRTMKNVYSGVPFAPFEGVKHNAVDDAMAQAKHLIKIYEHAGLALLARQNA